jgi:uncharacterized coiled-coil protein SlyX
MNSDLDQTWNDQPPSAHLHPARRRGPWVWFFLAVVLALLGSGFVYAWPEIASLIPAVGREMPAEQVTASDKGALPELLASQQKIEEDLAALNKSITDQQDQMKTIVDQLAALTTKVDALQRVAPPPAAPVAAEQPRASIAPTTPKPKKPTLRPSIHSGPVSIGGAPLNVTPGNEAN